MPNKIMMNINSLNNTPYYKNISIPLANNATVLSNMKPNSNLNASMIQRIHTAKAGCGSCGR